MKKQSLGDHNSEYAKSLVLAPSKEGKTVGILASLLGALPWQKYGGVVDDPANLHVLAFDEGATVGVKEFLVNLCGIREKDASRVRVYNFTQDVREVYKQQEDWDFTFFNAVVSTVKEEIEPKARGVSAVVVSSLTTLALTLQRAISGGPGDDAARGGGMDESKWQEFSRQVNEIRNLINNDKWHGIWEGHVYKPPKTITRGRKEDGTDNTKETIQVSGKAGYNFPNNVEQVFRFRRLFGETYEGTKVDQIYLDTRPAMDFVAGGRLFTTNLKPREEDMTVAFGKLGLKVGRWGAKKARK